MATTQRRLAQKAAKLNLREYCYGREGMEHNLEKILYRVPSFDITRPDGTQLTINDRVVQSCSICGRIVISEDEPD